MCLCIVFWWLKPKNSSSGLITTFTCSHWNYWVTNSERKGQTLTPASGQDLLILIIFIFLCWCKDRRWSDHINVAATDCIVTTQIPTNVTALKSNVLLLTHWNTGKANLRERYCKQKTRVIFNNADEYFMWPLLQNVQ